MIFQRLIFFVYIMVKKNAFDSFCQFEFRALCFEFLYIYLINFETTLILSIDKILKKNLNNFFIWLQRGN